MLDDEAIIQVIARIGAQLRRAGIKVTDLQILGHPQRAKTDRHCHANRQPRRTATGEVLEQPHQQRQRLPVEQGFMLEATGRRAR
ncbi:hypothetical protein D3C84_1015410 [compost metagenome]